MPAIKNKLFSQDYFEQLKKIADLIDFAKVDEFANLIFETAKTGKTIFFIGNGGSASLASHMAGDIGKNTVVDGSNLRFKTMCFSDNVPWLTAVANDASYADVFVEQLKNFANKGDLLVAISASGNSLNVIKALVWAKKQGVKTVGMLGFGGGLANDLVDLSIVVEAKHYGFVEGLHADIQHCVIEHLKKLVRLV